MPSSYQIEFDIGIKIGCNNESNAFSQVKICTGIIA